MFKSKILLFNFAIIVSFSAFANIAITPVHSINEIPQTAPLKGKYRLHLLDVGTGLSILIQGHDWNLLYDAGSADDKSGNQLKGNSNSRVVSYLYKAIGKSGVKSCQPAEDGWSGHTGSTQKIIDYVFLSHPHEDHGVMLDDVLECYKASNIYDSGRINNTVFYRRFIERVSEEIGVKYKTAKAPTANKKVKIKGKEIDLGNANWEQFKVMDIVHLDDSSSFTILHANGTSHESDPNSNSIVIRLDLGDVSVLLVGDAESGPRKMPSADLDGIEKELFDNFKDLIDTDILQVGHHGSLTSSRTKFIKAVSPQVALISAGPKKYGSVILPDEAIVESMEFQGIHILRTDAYDGETCPVKNKVGRNDDRSGGCANFILEW